MKFNFPIRIFLKNTEDRRMFPGTVYLKLDGVYSFLSTGTIRDIDIFVLLSFFSIGGVIKIV